MERGIEHQSIHYMSYGKGNFSVKIANYIDLIRICHKEKHENDMKSKTKNMEPFCLGIPFEFH